MKGEGWQRETGFYWESEPQAQLGEQFPGSAGTLVSRPYWDNWFPFQTGLRVATLYWDTSSCILLGYWFPF